MEYFFDCDLPSAAGENQTQPLRLGVSGEALKSSVRDPQAQRLEFLQAMHRLESPEQILDCPDQQCRDRVSRLFKGIARNDPYTRAHAERVVRYTTAIAAAYGCSRSQLYELRCGSLLHDIGKIYIRKTVLAKPESLTSREWLEMKRHPELGASLVRSFSCLEKVIPIILHHHERWDGQGYPFGLQGEEIPVGARIVAVADALDAMTSARVYQSPCSREDAYQEIVSCSGTRYDPQVVAAFQTAWDALAEQIEIFNNGRGESPTLLS